MDKQFFEDVGRGVRDAAYRGFGAMAGGPVDLAAMVMRPFGYSTPDNQVVGGSEWVGQKMQDAGLVSSSRNPVAEFLASVAIPAAAMRAGPAMYAAEQRMAQNAMAPRTLDPQTGAIVWHGSPHKFDKFDASKIGTGEGAQAYGHGLYLAENPGVAEGYKQTLAKIRDPYVKLDQAVFSSPKTHPLGDSAEWAAYDLKDKLHELAKTGKYPEGDFIGSDALPVVREAMALKRAELAAQKGSAKVQGLANLDALEKVIAENPSLISASTVKDHGSLYKVDLPDEHIAKMLDWDKPLSEQAPEVKSALEGIVSKLPKGKQDETLRSIRGQLADYELDWAPVTGANLYRQLGQLNGAGVRTTASGVQDANPLAADLFKQAGIPGIRYLDGGSRGAGQGTSNFVVFPGNESYLQILERNGQPLLK